MPRKKSEFEWKLNTPAFLLEIAKCSTVGIYLRPLQLLARMLYAVSERASELNDPRLNELMCKMALYEISDPYSPQYDRERVNAVLRLARKVQNAKRVKTSKRSGNLGRVQRRPRIRKETIGGLASGTGSATV